MVHSLLDILLVMVVTSGGGILLLFRSFPPMTNLPIVRVVVFSRFLVVWPAFSERWFIF